jgi:nucleoid-associated protein YgaU
MNKEAKVGLGVILVLAVLFVTTVGWRLYHSRTAEPALPAEGTASQKAESAGNAGNGAAAVSENAALAGGRPRVIAATNSSARSPQGAPSEDDLWNTGGGAQKNRVSDSGNSEPNRKPSYMPDLRRRAVPEQHDRYENADSRPPVREREQGSIFGDETKRDAAAYDDAPGRGRKSDAAATAGRTYTVAEGETLFDIARTELGKAARWVEIYDLNADALGSNIDNLRAGTQIVLPGDDGRQTDPLTRRAAAEYRK